SFTARQPKPISDRFCSAKLRRRSVRLFPDKFALLLFALSLQDWSPERKLASLPLARISADRCRVRRPFGQCAPGRNELPTDLAPEDGCSLARGGYILGGCRRGVFLARACADPVSFSLTAMTRTVPP